ncbi:hypothetical protein AXF42_Ash020950 [Apostasia shenzhenica]|uniref:Uncharacterized protein n=1 Tax=Apostasia shenzhenica TaxID=1088818 RepID=A0A2H9ZYT4_9ASPA|nr:hypothetical protein AXF42_Ash020950 [Apostasia shenzhenica]
MILARSGELNLNRFAQAPGDSAMEGLKQAMLEHELIFRNQVRELHRLYWTQKNLMNELSKGFSVAAERKHSADEKNAALSQFCRARELGASLDCNVAVQPEHNQRNFNLHLPADDFIRVPADLSQIEASMGNGTLEILRLGSPTGDGILKKNMSPQGFLFKEIIDLEKSMNLECNLGEIEAFSPDLKAPAWPTSGFFGSKPAILCDSASSSVLADKKNLTPSTISIGEESQEKEHPASSCVPGESRIAVVSYHSSNNHESRSVLIDLNVPHDDECFHDLIEPTVSIKDSSMLGHGVDVLEPIKCCPDGTSFVSELGSAKPAKPSSYEIKADNRADMNLTGSSDKALISSVDKWDSNITSSYSVTVPRNIPRDSSDKQRNREGSEEDTLSSQEDTQHKKYSIGYSTDDSVTTQLNSPKNEISLISDQKIEEEEQEVSVATAAAEALVSISLGSVKLVECDGRSNQPQHSSDSFELMTLRLSEVRNEDPLAMPESSSMNETGKEGGGIRLRRGRRLRDFRKEILPGLLPLSRHEICEDMHNIGYKLRKRTSISAGESWVLPVKNRRSRVYSGGRR